MATRLGIICRLFFFLRADGVDSVDALLEFRGLLARIRGRLDGRGGQGAQAERIGRRSEHEAGHEHDAEGADLDQAVDAPGPALLVSPFEVIDPLSNEKDSHAVVADLDSRS
jgi:hypothetical protein